MDKTFKITGKVEFDDQDFNRSIDQMQKKLKEIYAPGDIARSQNSMNSRMTGAGIGGGFQPINPGNNLQARREMDQMTIAQNRTNQALAQRIIERLNNETKISRMIKENNNLSKEEVGILEAKLKANQEITEEMMKQHTVRRQAIDKTLADKERRQTNMNNIIQGRGYQLDGMSFDETGKGAAGGGGGGGGFNKGLAAVAGAIGPLAKAASAVMATAIAGTAIINKMYGMPINTISAQGSATTGFLGETLESIGSGDTTNLNAFGKERSEALEMANQKHQGPRRSSLPTSMSQMFPWLAGGVMAGATGNAEYLDNFYAQKAKDQADDYNEALKGMKEKDPQRIKAMEYYQKNKARDLANQRQLGLDYNTYQGKGGYLESATGGGAFSQDAMQSMKDQLMGSGGGTAMGRSPLGALQLQSGMNLTNAGSIMGKIGGQTGNSGLAQQLTEKMLEEAVARGFNRSEFTEEFRQFADMAGTIIANSGAQTGADATRLTQGLGRFVGDTPTMGGLTGAKSAYEEYQQQSSSTSGRMGALQYAQMLKDPTLSKLGAQGIGGLMEMPEEDLNEQNIMVRGQAAKAGVKPQDIVTAAAKAKRQLPGIATGLGTTEMDKVDKYFEQNGLDESTVDINALPGDIKGTYIKMIESGTTIGGYGGTQKAEARTRGMRKGFAGTTPGQEQTATPGRNLAADEVIELAKRKAQSAQTGKQEDINQRNVGQANLKSLENFREYSRGFDVLGTSMDTFFGKVFKYAADLHNAPASAQPHILTQTSGNKATTQPQAGKPSSGKGP